jgi:hypothetical protein
MANILADEEVLDLCICSFPAGTIRCTQADSDAAEGTVKNLSQNG